MEKSEKKRGIFLSIWLILMLVGNFRTTLSYLLGAFTNSALLLPNIPLWATYTFGILALFNFIFIIFLFKWRKWAFFALCGTIGLAFIVDLIIGTGIYSALHFVGLIILYLAMRPKWNFFE